MSPECFLPSSCHCKRDVIINDPALYMYSVDCLHVSLDLGTHCPQTNTDLCLVGAVSQGKSLHLSAPLCFHVKWRKTFRAAVNVSNDDSKALHTPLANSKHSIMRLLLTRVFVFN